MLIYVCLKCVLKGTKFLFLKNKILSPLTVSLSKKRNRYTSLYSITVPKLNNQPKIVYAFFALSDSISFLIAVVFFLNFGVTFSLLSFAFLNWINPFPLKRYVVPELK